MSATQSAGDIKGFGFRTGRILAGKYEVIALLGAGWEGEVYLVRETATGIERAAKFFFPKRNPGNKNLTRYAKKLHRLRHCPILIQYFTQETILFRGSKVAFLVSEYVEGELLRSYLDRQRGKRIDSFLALRLLYDLVLGVEDIHNSREYHGDLHSENIIIERSGLGFEVKVIDLYHWNAAKQENIHDDVCDLVRILYDAVGGAKHYAKQPQEIKSICCGLKRTLILKKFKTAGQLRRHIEIMSWD